MKRSTELLLMLFVTGISLLVTGCGNRMSESAILAAMDTAVAATDIAQAAELQQTIDAEAAFTPTETTAPTITITPTAEPTNTSTPEPGDFEPPLVQVSLDTNCRSGPGKVYTYEGGLFVGQESTVHGIDPSGSWYYIANPDLDDEYCWIWGFYAEMSVDTDPLPIFTPGPTPNTVPEFTAEYRELETCDGAWRVEFTIKNTGPVNIDSISVHVLNTVTDEQTGLSEMNNFMATGGCDLVYDEDLLFPGESGFTISYDLSEDPTGHYSYATITACTQENLAGNCSISEFPFTP